VTSDSELRPDGQELPDVRRRAGWFILAASLVGIGLVLWQMSRQEPASSKVTTTPSIEAAPPLWTPRVADQREGPPATTPSTPAVATPSTPAVASLSAQQVQAAIDEWSVAWSSRNADTYLAFYAPEFANREGFARQKRSVMGRAKSIEVTVSELSLSTLSDGRVSAEFTQRYQSDTFQSTDKKRQVWALVKGRPQIVSEATRD